MFGVANNGIGVKASGNMAIDAPGDFGVVPVAAAADSDGVHAAGVTAHVAGFSSAGYSLSARLSGKANLYLQPNNDIASSVPKTPSAQRTDAHETGELDCVGGDLWFCVAGRTPGTWRKLSGPAVAGGYVT